MPYLLIFLYKVVIWMPNWFAVPFAEALFLRAFTICSRSVVSIGLALEWPAQTRSRYQVSVVFPSVDGFAP
jgi:hypothetical protein